MLPESKVYTLAYTCNAIIAPNTGETVTFSLENFHRVMKIISIDYDIVIYDATPARLDVNDTGTIGAALTIGATSAQRIAKAFTTPAPAGSLVANGTSIIFNRPMQKKFDSFYIRETLPFSHAFGNNDLVDSYWYQFNICIEVIEL